MTVYPVPASTLVNTVEFGLFVAVEMSKPNGPEPSSVSVAKLRLNVKFPDVKEVKNGYECGLNIENFNDIKVGDHVEAFHEVEVAKQL